jgi:integrase
VAKGSRQELAYPPQLSDLPPQSLQLRNPAQYVASNPIDRMEKVTLDEKLVEILTVEQAARLLEAAELAGGTMTPFVAVGLFAGLRTREIAVLDWKASTLPGRQSRFMRSRPNPAREESSRYVTISQLGCFPTRRNSDM